MKALAPFDEATPSLFDRRELLQNRYFLRLDMTKFGQKVLPPVPDIDFRKLSNADWIIKYKRPALITTLTEKLELYPDLFEESAGFIENFQAGLHINLNVMFGDQSYYSSALMGNFIQVSDTLNMPVVEYPADGISPDSLFTLVMLTPDHPFRLDPYPEPFVHWMISNIPGNEVSKGETVTEYLPPLPTEYAGTFRYVFMLFKQDSHIDVNTLKTQEIVEEEEEEEQEVEEGEEQDGSVEENADMRRRRFLYNMLHNSFLQSGALPSAISSFRTEYDFCVTEAYQRMGIDEPFYIPADLATKILGKKSTSYNRFRSAWQ